MTRPLILLALLTLASCQHHPAPSQPITPITLPPQPAAAPSPATTSPTSPHIRYAAHGHPDPLTPAQLTELTTLATELRPPNRDLWFILVLYNNARHEAEPGYNAIVYFTPDTTTPRLRTGQCTEIDTTGISVAQHRAIVKRLNPHDHYPRLSPYVQISAVTAPFKADDLAVPANRDLPIDPPANLPHADLVAIIDAARQLERPFSKVLADQPVVRIEGGGPFIVYFGWQVGGLNGGGSAVRVEHTPAGYQADPDIAFWVS